MKISKGQLSQKRVLFVDDSATNREAASRLFQSKDDIALTAVGKPDQAFDLAEKAASGGEPYRLFILDIEMEPFDGFALAGKLKLCQSYRDTPVLFFTSAREVEKIEKAWEIGSEVLHKSHLSSLGSKVKYLLNS